nr:MAG TPA: hypothetical protein [Caudoviricetes sp.]
MRLAASLPLKRDAPEAAPAPRHGSVGQSTAPAPAGGSNGVPASPAGTASASPTIETKS